MISLYEVASLVLVGAFWGCTNPFLRKGSEEAERERIDTSIPSSRKTEGASKSSEGQSLLSSLSKFRRLSVWLPYVINQSGSLLYYFTLSQSDLSLAVPICNALSLVFSIVTSYALGERIDHPIRTAVGSALVMGGVAICLFARDHEEVEKHVQEEL